MSSQLFALSAHVGTPFGVTSTQGPSHSGACREEIPVLGLAQNGFRTRNLRLGVDEFGGERGLYHTFRIGRHRRLDCGSGGTRP